MSNRFSNSTVMAKLRKRLSGISSELEKSNEFGINMATYSLIRLEGELLRDASSVPEKKILLHVSMARGCLGCGRIDEARKWVEKAVRLTTAD